MNEFREIDPKQQLTLPEEGACATVVIRARQPALRTRRHRALAVLSWLCLCGLFWGAAAESERSVSPAPAPGEITVHTNFQAASVGGVDFLGAAELRVHVAGQANEVGRNRQATWYYFRLEGVRNREVTVHLTDLVGEYNYRPACAMNADTVPVFSEDGVTWQHFGAMEWNDQRKEATLRFQSSSNAVWVAHVPPYPLSRLQRWMAEVALSPYAQVEVIGHSIEKRDLHLVTITDPKTPPAGKRCIWLLARQHAWESGTSFILEGVVDFLLSQDPAAVQMRNGIIFRISPTMDPDGLVSGHVRFNARGYDLNRHWPEVEVAQAQDTARWPEIWAVKRALWTKLDLGERVDLLLNLHNTETGECLDTQADAPEPLRKLRALHANLVKRTTFDPSAEPAVTKVPADTTNSLWVERQVPAMILEQRIGTSHKLGHRPRVTDRLEFGRQLALELGNLVLAESTSVPP